MQSEPSMLRRTRRRLRLNHVDAQVVRPPPGGTEQMLKHLKLATHAAPLLLL